MLVAFDFDGTLSDSEMTVLLGEEAGVSEKITAITERAMNDEIGYAESLRERAALLDGLPRERVEDAFGRVQLREGAGDLIDDLRAAGNHVAILTGGFERGVELALEDAGTTVDSIVANRLPLADSALTGEVKGPLVDGTKDDELDRLATTLDFARSETVAVGDGANDLPMLRAAGLAVGYAPKPAVEPHCDVSVKSMARLGDLLAERDVL